MLWNLSCDKKVRLHAHRGQIGSFLFCGKGLRWLASLDQTASPALLLSDWASLRRVGQKRLARRPWTVDSTRAVYVERRRLLVFLESCAEAEIARLSVAELRNEGLGLGQSETLQEFGECLALHYFDCKLSVALVAVERFRIKIWLLVHEKFVLDSRVHSKEEISASFLHVERSLLYFITGRSVLNVMNQEVSQFS